MLRTVIIGSDGELERGGRELLEAWREDQSRILWLDMVDEPEARERSLLLEFGIHPLAIQDAQRQRHPPKLEYFEDHIFLLLRGLDATTSDLSFGTIQIALFAFRRVLITRRNGVSVSTDHWWDNPDLPAVLREGGIKLALNIAKTSALRYTDLLLEFEPMLSECEDRLQDKPDDTTMRELTGYRTRLRKLRRIFSYHTRIFDLLGRGESDLFSARAGEYRHEVTDVYEKYERLQSLSGMYYELAGDLVEGYISLTSHELNTTMRILTVLTAIFVPLGFLAGLYGMNFDHMPELHWKGAYFVLLAFMASIAGTLLYIFRRNKWL